MAAQIAALTARLETLEARSTVSAEDADAFWLLFGMARARAPNFRRRPPREESLSAPLDAAEDAPPGPLLSTPAGEARRRPPRK